MKEQLETAVLRSTFVAGEKEEARMSLLNIAAEHCQLADMVLVYNVSLKQGAIFS